MTRKRAADFAALLATGGQGDRPHGHLNCEDLATGSVPLAGSLSRWCFQGLTAERIYIIRNIYKLVKVKQLTNYDN